jgi:hypothetical protein
MTNEDQRYVEIFQALLLSGEFAEEELEGMTHMILDNPDKFPEYAE